MKIKQLIAKLQKLDPEIRVITDGYEGGYRDVKKIKKIKIVLNVNTKWYYGPHDRERDYPNKRSVNAYLFL